jgi:uncharacterized coiled-coil DUF342 family protein
LEESGENNALSAETSKNDGANEQVRQERQELRRALAELQKRIENKACEAKALEISYNEARRQVGDYFALKKKLKHLEFSLATEALTLRHERGVMKEIKKTEAELEKTRGVEELRRELVRAQRKAAELEEERKRIEKQIEDLRGAAKKRREEERKRAEEERMSRFVQSAIAGAESNQGMVSLGSLCVIKKKG